MRTCPFWQNKQFMLLLLIPASGCLHSSHANSTVDPNIPRELAKVPLPEYVIEAPDILKIDALQLIPLPPYKIQSLDVLGIRVLKTLPEEPIAGLYSVEPDGTVNLGGSYGKVSIGGMTLDDAKKTIQDKLGKLIKDTQVEITIAQGRGVQQIRGEHLVRPDGSVSLGSYGSVRVSGMTLLQAKNAIEMYLTKYLQHPEVSVDVLAYNSKLYYVIYDQGGAGQRIFRLPSTGNDTVLDAVSQLSGLSPVSDQNKIWIARPTPDSETPQIFSVNWNAMTASGKSDTNYQLFPGDRLFVQANPLITLDTKIARVISPFERIFGFALLGSGTITSLRFQNTSSGNGTGTVP